MSNNPLLRYPRPVPLNEYRNVPAGPAQGSPSKVNSLNNPIVVPSDRWYHITHVSWYQAGFVENVLPDTVMEFQFHRNEIVTYNTSLITVESQAGAMMTDIYALPGDKLLFQWKNLDAQTQYVTAILHGQQFVIG